MHDLKADWRRWTWVERASAISISILGITAFLSTFVIGAT